MQVVVLNGLGEWPGIWLALPSSTQCNATPQLGPFPIACHVHVLRLDLSSMEASLVAKPPSNGHTSQRDGWTQRCKPWLPLAAVCIAFCTIAACYCLSRPHLPRRIVIPFISLMGFLHMSRWVYAGGFTVVVLLWMASGIALRRELAPYCASDPFARQRSCELSIAYWSSVIAGLGIVVCWGCVCDAAVWPLCK